MIEIKFELDDNIYQEVKAIAEAKGKTIEQYIKNAMLEKIKGCQI